MTAYSVVAFRLTQFLWVGKVDGRIYQKSRFWLTESDARKGVLNLNVNIQHISMKSNCIGLFVYPAKKEN